MHAAYSVLDNDTGKLINYGQLRKHPNYKETWNKYFSNEIQTVPFTAVPNPPKLIVAFPKPSPICYPAPTSKGYHDQDRVTTTKGAFKQQTPVTLKGQKVAFNHKVDQEIIAARARSQFAHPPSLPPFEVQHQPLDAPVAARTRSRTVSQNFTNT